MARDFVDAHDLWTAADRESASSLLGEVRTRGLRAVRFAFVDHHGLVRVKTLSACAVESSMRAGVRMVGTLLLKDSSNRTAWPVFAEGGAPGDAALAGASDVVLVADPSTFRVLPWLPDTGWVQCDAYHPDGRPVAYDTRRVLREALSALEARGLRWVSGLEVEFHVYRLDPVESPRAHTEAWPADPPTVAPLEGGYQLLSEQRADRLEPALDELRRHAQALGLPVRSVEAELGPSQCEFVFDAMEGLASADAMALFRSAAKQAMARRGLHATFMCKPQLPGAMASGWHLHQSLRDAGGANAFMPDASERDPAHARHHLSATGAAWLAGLLAHAPAYAAFAAPTINAYRRYQRAHVLAPNHVVWGADNRGAMLRVIGAPADPATRIENRIGEPAANPYLCMAAQIHAGLDGLAAQADPGPPCASPYATSAARLPSSLDAALDALDASACMRRALGDARVDWFLRIKRFELARFHAEVTAWEQREYFEHY